MANINELFLQSFSTIIHFVRFKFKLIECMSYKMIILFFGHCTHHYTLLLLLSKILSFCYYKKSEILLVKPSNLFRTH